MKIIYSIFLPNCVIVCNWYFLPNLGHGSLRRAMALVGSRAQIPTSVVYARALCVPQYACRNGGYTYFAVRTDQSKAWKVGHGAR